MGTVLAIIVLIIVLPYFASRISQARSGSWAGPRTPGMRQRAALPRPARKLGAASARAVRSAGTAVLHPRTGHVRAQARADIDRLVTEAGLADWLEERREERAAQREERDERREERREERARRAGTSPAGTPPAPSAAPPPPPAPAGPPPQASAQPSSNGGNPVATGTSTAGAEQAIEAVDRLLARAAAGNILTKREVILALHEVFTRASAGITGLSRTMAEPGSNYGTEITEPLAKAGTQAQAAAMCLADVDAPLVALLRRSVAEMATSGQRVPHHQNELSESGTR